jgi:hypothetical protein
MWLMAHSIPPTISSQVVTRTWLTAHSQPSSSYQQPDKAILTFTKAESVCGWIHYVLLAISQIKFTVEWALLTNKEKKDHLDRLAQKEVSESQELDASEEGKKKALKTFKRGHKLLVTARNDFYRLYRNVRLLIAYLSLLTLVTVWCYSLL